MVTPKCVLIPSLSCYVSTFTSLIQSTITTALYRCHNPLARFPDCASPPANLSSALQKRMNILKHKYYIMFPNPSSHNTTLSPHLQQLHPTTGLLLCEGVLPVLLPQAPAKLSYPHIRLSCTCQFCSELNPKLCWAPCHRCSPSPSFLALIPGVVLLLFMFFKN